MKSIRTFDFVGFRNQVLFKKASVTRFEEKLAVEAGVDRATVFRLTTGGKNISLDATISIAHCLEINLTDFFITREDKIIPLKRDITADRFVEKKVGLKRVPKTKETIKDGAPHHWGKGYLSS